SCDRAGSGSRCRVRVAAGKFCELEPDQWREAGGESVLEHSGPAVRGNQSADQRCLPFLSHSATLVLQIGARHCENEVTFAQRWPVEAVGFVQNDFVQAGLSVGPLCRAQDYFDPILAPGSIRVRDKHCWMWLRPSWNFPTEN